MPARERKVAAVDGAAHQGLEEGRRRHGRSGGGHRQHGGAGPPKQQAEGHGGRDEHHGPGGLPQVVRGQSEGLPRGPHTVGQRPDPPVGPAGPAVARVQEAEREDQQCGGGRDRPEPGAQRRGQCRGRRPAGHRSARARRSHTSPRRVRPTVQRPRPSPYRGRRDQSVLVTLRDNKIREGRFGASRGAPGSVFPARYLVLHNEPYQPTLTYSPRGIGRLWTDEASGRTVSRHLSVLRLCRLVTSRRSGRRVLHQHTEPADELPGTPARSAAPGP
ncbi:hypothetical protein STANM309S_02177 [Streptomyces tanashiensis]